MATWLMTALPEVILATGILVILMIGAFLHERMAPKYVRHASGLVLLLALFATVFPVTSDMFAFDRILDAGQHAFYLIDPLAQFGKVLVLSLALFCLFMARDYLKKIKVYKFEYSILIMLATLGAMVLISSHDLLSFYIGLELMSFSLYILAAYRTKQAMSSEAGLKYFILGSLASGFVLFGISILYGLTGQTAFSALEAALAGNLIAGGQMLLAVGLVMLLVGLAFKVSAVPFHVWTPDVYQGAPTPVTTFMATVPKVAAMVIFIRMLTGPLAGLEIQWQPVMVLLTVMTMAVGAMAAAVQSDLKRLLAYSSIGHVGFMLVALTQNTATGVAAVLYYLVVYGCTVLGIFAVLLSLRARDRFVTKIADLKGLSAQAPFHSFALLIFMFSLAGIPPFAGFFAKLFAFKAAVENGMAFLAILAVLFSVVAAYYCLRVIKVVYFETGGKIVAPDFPVILKAIMTVMAVLVIGLAIWPDGVMQLAEQAAAQVL